VRVDLDAARWLPCTYTVSGGFVRFGEPSCGRVPHDGIFMVAYRTLAERTMEHWETEALRDALSWFEEHMPVCCPRDRRAVLFLRDRQRDLARRMWDLAFLLRSMGVFVEMVGIRDPGRVIAADEVQVAAVHHAHRPHQRM
jgi:hypothetical protein